MSPVDTKTKIEGKVWDCKIGPFKGDLADGADSPMAKAVKRAYKEITGEDAEFIFSGWGGKFTEEEKEIIEESAARVAEDEESRPS